MMTNTAVARIASGNLMRARLPDGEARKQQTAALPEGR